MSAPSPELRPQDYKLPLLKVGGNEQISARRSHDHRNYRRCDSPNPQGTPNENWNLVKQINATVFDLGLPSAYSSRGNVVFTAPLPPQNNPVPGARPYVGVIYPGWLLGTGIPFPAFQTNVGTLITKVTAKQVVTSHPGDPTQ